MAEWGGDSGDTERREASVRDAVLPPATGTCCKKEGLVVGADAGCAVVAGNVRAGCAATCPHAAPL